MKKHLSIIALFVLFCHFAESQSLTDLDNKKGFKTIKLGDDYSKYSSELILLGVNQKYGFNKYIFNPTDTDLRSVFSFKMDSIILTFNKIQKLVDITITKYYTGDYSLQNAGDDAKSIREALISLFGKYTSTISVNNSEELKLGVVWTASTTILKDYWKDFGMHNGTKLFVTLTDIKFLEDTFGLEF